MSENILDNKEIKLAILLKTQQLKREDLPTLTTQHLCDTLKNMVWKYKMPSNIHKAVNDIMNLDVSTIVSFLSVDAVRKGARMNVEDIKKIMEGDSDE